MKKARLQFCILLLSVWAVTLCQAQSTEDPNTAKQEQKTEEIKLELNFMNAPLQTIVEYLSEKAGLVILSNDGLDQRMTVISKSPVGVDEAIDLINTVLKENGYTAFLRGRTLRVTTLSNSIREAGMKVDQTVDPNKMPVDDTMQFQIVPIRYRDATQLAVNLQPLIPEYGSLQANQEGNVLMISDTRANIKRLLEIVRAMDKPLSAVAKMQVFRLRYAEASSVATLINNMFKEQASSSSSRNQSSRGGSSRGGRGGPGGGPQAMFEMFANRGGNNGSADPSRGSVPVNAAGDERTNSVVVSASEDRLTLIAELIKQMDTVTPELADIRVYHLKNADATTVADVVNQMFAADSGSRSNQGGSRSFGGRGGPGGFMQMMQQNSTASTSSPSNAQVLASADERTNSVVVSGPPETFPVIEQLITTLDTTQANIADVKVYHLQHADAENAAELINDVFGANATSRRSSSSQQSTRTFRGGGGFGQPQATQSSGSNAEVIASADSRTNSIVVSGPPETLIVIEGIIKELDANPEQERRIFPYPLKNANAANVMEILNSLFDEIQNLNQANTGRNNQTFQGGGGRGGGGQTTSSGGTSGTGTGSAGGLDEETYFEADEESNILLVMTSAKNYELVKPIIDELDKPVGQVLIKVLFAEVTLKDSLDLGFEFSNIDLLNGNDTTISGSTTFGSPTTGLSVSSFAGDLDLKLSALQETGKLNVLTRPYNLTSNTQAATITVADEVAIPENSNTTSTGIITVNYTYRDDIGITLTVTPSINPNGLVNMTVTPKITTQSTEKVDIGYGVFASTFSTRSASTKVAVMTGQTIVIGGLIEDKSTNTVKKVPILGSIPLAGALFRRTEKESTKTELLIFLTPFVAKDALALTPISDKERSLSNIQNDKELNKIFERHMTAMAPIKDPNENADATKK
ncbi:MAG: hypothetical protein K9N55_03190 [Phycisphaerae bacterium]|nr:hypothetical protein [Phycisphaerae bacterium]